MSHVGELGSGAGKGGGGGGSIREAGGSFGKMEAAREEEFFYKQVDNWPLNILHIYVILPPLVFQQKEQLKNLKTKTDNKSPEPAKK